MNLGSVLGTQGGPMNQLWARRADKVPQGRPRHPQGRPRHPLENKRCIRDITIGTGSGFGMPSNVTNVQRKEQRLKWVSSATRRTARASCRPFRLVKKLKTLAEQTHLRRYWITHLYGKKLEKDGKGIKITAAVLKKSDAASGKYHG